jgi:DNA-binding NtrC family response regulator
MTGAARDLQALSILVVDDEDDLRLGLERLVARLGGVVRSAADGQDALALLEQAPADIVVTDLMMPRVSGSALLDEVKRRMPETEVVILTGYGTIQTAVSCLQMGAAHFLTKPFDNDEVLRVLRRLGRQVVARRRGGGSGQIEPTAVDPAMSRVVELARRAARSPVPVLIEGESGTGKELIARVIHRASSVADRPFLAVNAAALPDTLLESELFGHRKGAFTGADRDRDGLFVEARGGTVFLDEVASMSASFQGKLLRVLQEKVVRPLGGTRDVPVEFRLLAATNRDLEGLIASGAFREDLFYRLSVVRVHVPPLRDRPRDIAPLARHFLEEAARLCLGPDAAVPVCTPEALEALTAWSWPGNVRELQNTLQRAVIVCSQGRILPHHLGLTGSTWGRAGAAQPESPTHDYGEAKEQAIARFQREFLERALERTGGNVSQAAEQCGLTRAALQRIMRSQGIDREAFRPGS